MSETNLSNSKIVSFESEELILVNDADEEIGYASKGACHDGSGILHRAFSLLIFNSKNELLLQQRSPEKRLWGGFWSNSCCSHPRKGETMAQATVRRMDQELGIQCDLTFLYKFQYAVEFGDKGSERELCWVYVGRTDEEPKVNPTEISAWRYIGAEQLERELAENPEQFTPWFKQEWRQISEQHQDWLAA